MFSKLYIADLIRFAFFHGGIAIKPKINFYNKEPYYGKLHNKGTTFEIMEDNFKEIFDVINLE